jgi:hypothetical protein
MGMILLLRRRHRYGQYPRKANFSRIFPFNQEPGANKRIVLELQMFFFYHFGFVRVCSGTSYQEQHLESDAT